MKVALAQFIYESNTFNPVEAEMDRFRGQGTWLTEPDAICAWAQTTDTQLQSSMQALGDAGCETVPVFVAICGTPGGRLSVSCHQELKTAFLAGLRSVMPVDAMVLHLHGAVCAVGVDDVEGEWLKGVREELNFTGPIVVSLDLHANVTEEMLRHADAITAYRTAPHVDFKETGERAAKLLLSQFASTTRTLAKVHGLFSPTATHHERGPFAALLAQARELEQVTGVADISLFPVQPWLDVDGLSSSVVVTSTDPHVGAEVAGQLAEAWWKNCPDWPSGLLSWSTIVSRLAEPTHAPWFLIDTADATTGGSDGSSAEAVRHLWPLRNELVAPVLLWRVDSELASIEAEIGAECDLDLPEIRVMGKVIFRGECRFRARGNAYTGQEVFCGKAVVLAAGQLRIVVTELGCLCSDPAFYEAVGLAPGEALAVHVKSLLGWQAGYRAGPERGLYFDGPGQTSLNFARLSFSPARRQLYPISQSPPNPVSLWQST